MTMRSTQRQPDMPEADMQESVPEAEMHESTEETWPAPIPAPDVEAPALEPGVQPHVPLQQRGPLVAVCALCGGAGASTLAYLLACSAALDPDGQGAPVLALDAGGTTGGLSLYAHAASHRSLAELAEDLRIGRPASAPMFTTAPGGVRLIATDPRLQPEADMSIVARILADAREAHRMTVVDCGTLSLPAERVALELATHVIWVLPATEHGLRRADVSPWSVVSSDVVQVVVARRDPTDKRAPMRALAEVAAARDCTLVLMPHVDGLGKGFPDQALEQCAVTLQALATKLRQ
jgi:hypothetical protein